MTIGRKSRLLLGLAGGLTVVLATLYLFRWTFFGGIVRGEIDALAARIPADVRIGSLGGGLLSSLYAKDVTLQPRPGAPFREASVRRVRVSYGLFGSSEPVIKLEGLRVVLAPAQGPPTPVHEVIREVVSHARTFRFPGRIEVQDAHVILPDGEDLAVEGGMLDHASASARLQASRFGRVEASATGAAGGALEVRARASEGILREAIFDLKAGADRPDLHLEAQLGERRVVWDGHALFAQGTLTRIEGKLIVPEGYAVTSADFISGRAEVDMDAQVELQEELKGRAVVTARAEGPLAGPYKRWTVRGGSIRVRGGVFRSLRIDDIEAYLGHGALSELPFQAAARSADDVVEFKGLFRWRERAEVEGTARVVVEDLDPYFDLLGQHPLLWLHSVRGEGKLGYKADGFFFEGSVESGAGTFDDYSWEALSFRGSVAPSRIRVEEAILRGTAFGPRLAVSGALEGEQVALRIEAGTDKGEVDGRLSRNGDFDGRFRVEGPLAWLSAYRITLPPELVPVRAQGAVTRQDQVTQLSLDLSAGTDIAAAPKLTLRPRGNAWGLEVAAGSITLPGPRRLDHDAFEIALGPGRVSAGDLRIRCPELEAAARVIGSVVWTEKETNVSLDVRELSAGKVALDPLAGRLSVDRESGISSIGVEWGPPDGDHLRVSGRIGRQNDLRAELQIRDFTSPLIRRFVPGLDLQGGLALDVHLTGTDRKPEASGTLAIRSVAAAGLPALNLTVPLRVEENRLRLWAVEERTPYGRVVLDGTIPLPGTDPEAPLDLSLKVTNADLFPLLKDLPESTRRWIPPGRVAATASLRGSLSKPGWSVRGDFEGERFQPPAPLGEATDLRVAARLDAAGLEFLRAEGRLGQGPFHASGRWDLFKPARPLTLEIAGEEALVVNDVLARVRVSPQVRLSCAEGRLVRIEGKVTVPLLLYHHDFVASGRRSSGIRDVTVPGLRLVPAEAGGHYIPGIPGMEDVEIDLEVASGGELRLENSVVGIILEAAGRLQGTAGDPIATGRIRARADRGEVKVGPGIFIRVQSAEVILPDAPSVGPSVHFIGRVGSGESAITVRVSGPLDEPGLLLQSDPPRPQRELLARLAFGQEIGTALRPGAAGYVLAKKLYSQIVDEQPRADREESFFDKINPSLREEADLARRKPWELPGAGTARGRIVRTEVIGNDYFSIVAESSPDVDVSGDVKLRIRF